MDPVAWCRHVGIVALVLVLPTREIAAVLRQYVRLGLLITVFAVATEPLARIHIDPLGISPPLAGWHGFFVHKNVMAAFLLIAIATVLHFDRNRLSQFLSLAAVALLFAMSHSTTGMMAALMLVAVKIWLTANRGLTSRSSAAFAASTGALVIFAGVGIGASLSALADAAGKDLTFTGRTKIWSATWSAILRDPILGHGSAGLFGTPRSIETGQVMREIGFQAGHPHNGLLDVAVQLGAVGVVIVLVVVASIFQSSLKLQRRAPEVAGFALCIVSGIVMMSVGESVFLGSSLAILILLRTLTLRESMAAVTGLETVAPPRRERPRAEWKRGARSIP